MSSRKLKATENNENLCPVTGKRLRLASPSKTKSSPHSAQKFCKLESTSSPTVLPNEYLEEMGIGMLDSEESCSSAVSAITLAFSGSASASAEENSNEATPNLDAAKIRHERILSTYRSIDNSLDNSSDNANNSFIDPNETLKEVNSNSNNNKISNCIAGQRCSNNNSNSNSSFDIFTNDMQQQTQLRKSTEKLHKKIAILGAGAGNATTQSVVNNHNSNSNSPSSTVNTVTGRSPLATVACNSHYRNSLQQQQQQLQQQHLQQQATNSNGSISNNSNSSNNTNTHVSVKPHAVIGGTTSQNAQQQQRGTHGISMQPSTSQQAALMKQQQQSHYMKVQKEFEQLYQQLEQQQTQQQLITGFVPNENFFLYRPRQAACDSASDSLATMGNNHFESLSDEMILQVFKWLPKKALLRCCFVNRRFKRCAEDESLWARLDMGGRSLRPGALQNILTRGVVVLRLAQAELNHPVFEAEFLKNDAAFESRLQYLDLSMASITKPSLKMLLSRCQQLKKLSLEHVPVNDEICNEIAKNTNLEALNMAMSIGLEAWSVRKLMESLKNLNSLNISWTNLSVDAVTSLVTNVTPNLMRLNIAGCRKTMFDSHVATLVKRCTQLLELDLSDCTGLTSNAVNLVCKFKMLEYLSLSRCYLITPSAYAELRFLLTLTYLDVFGMLTDPALETLQRNFPKLGINKFIHSSVARPTVGTRRTSIWGLRTRD